MMTLRHLVLVAGLALVAQPVVAADTHRGGGGGHSYPGAVTRGGGGGGRSYPGTVTRGRGGGGRSYPGAVTRRGGGGRHYYRPAYGGRNSYYGGYRGGHYGRYPYYGGNRGGYYGRYPYYGGYYGSSYYGFDWPYYGAYWGGYYPPRYSYAPDVVDDYDNAAPAETAIVDSNGNRPPDADSKLVRLRLEVRPDDTSVYVDDQFQGTARETRMLYLPPGSHKIELVRPGFTTEVREVLVALGGIREVSVELQRP